VSIEQNKQVAMRLYELLDAANPTAVGDLVTPDYAEHDPLPGQGTGRDGAVDRFSMIVAGLSPHFRVEDVVAEQDTVVVRWTNSGTHSGDFAGIPATGRPFTIGGIDIYRVRDGLLAEHWHQLDQLAMLGQLGLIPAPTS
jgi:predicted ester cyclase